MEFYIFETLGSLCKKKIVNKTFLLDVTLNGNIIYVLEYQSDETIYNGIPYTVYTNECQNN